MYGKELKGELFSRLVFDYILFSILHRIIFPEKFLTNILCRLWLWYCQESWPACLLPSFVFRWYKGLQSSHGPVSSCFNCISGTRERVSSYLYVLYPSFSYWKIHSAGWTFSFFSTLQLCSGTLGYLIPILSFFPFCTRHNYKGIYACTCLCVCAHTRTHVCVCSIVFLGIGHFWWCSIIIPVAALLTMKWLCMNCWS